MNIADIIARHAADTPGAPAVVEGGRTWSYQDFDAAITCAAGAIHAAGLAAGDVACLNLPSGALHLAASYALARLGAVQLALSEKDSAQRHHELAGRFSAKALLAVAGAAPLPGLQTIVADPGWLDHAPASTRTLARTPGGDSGWKIALTSGTTGTQKAVLLSHAMQEAWCDASHSAVPVLPGDRYLAIIGLGFDAGLRHCLCVHWGGGAVVFEPPSPTVEALFATVERAGITYLGLSPAQLGQILPVCKDDQPRLPSLRVLRSGGMVHSAALRRDVRRKINPNFHILYGTNDGGSPFTCASGEMVERHPESVGLPCRGVEIGITDESGRPLQDGEIGHVRVRAVGTPRGYINDPEATALRFRDGWYYPGDLGWLSPEGGLHFKGRADDLMNYDGLKIFPSEIENALLAHPEVAEAAAFSIPSPLHQDVPVAAVVLRGATSVADLRRFCAEQLGSRAPKSIAVLTALPRNAMGKVDKRRLAQLVATAGEGK